MKQCEHYQELFVEALYDELPKEQLSELKSHLNSCAPCSAAYRKLESTLQVMSQRTRTEPDEAYWKNYWNTLDASIQKESEVKQEKRNILPLRFAWQPAWSYGIAATLLLAVGLYLGKYIFSNQETVNSQPTTVNLEQNTTVDTVISNQQFHPPQAGKEIKNQNSIPETGNRKPETNQLTRLAAQSYLDRSKVMLLGLINSEDDASLSFSRQQKISRSLLHEAADLKPRLIEPDQQRIKQLIDELEVILLQLANIEEQSDLPAIELVKKGVDEKAILLKINMEEMRAMKSKQSQKKSLTKEHKSL
ncbi:MAG: zf-HC2 domain-containing protein [Ignavibacteriae bacterium]|nr:zf-HC2 domain-containing protein [Ignavibacteriota bacterium]